MTIVDLKKEYRKHLDIIKDDANGKTTKEDSLLKLIEAYNEIIKIEPECPIDSPAEIKEKFIDKVGAVKDVLWFDDLELTKTQEKELDDLERIRRLAYIWVKRNHPKLSDQLDKFGQIVNARMQLIIAHRG